MKRYDSFEQGTPEWAQARVGKITASRCKDARDRLADKPEKTNLKTGEVTPAQRGAPTAKQTAYAAQVAIERIAGKPIDQVFQNWQMKEGHVQEPFARMAYEEITGHLVEEVGAFSTDDDQFLYSPDGTVDEDGLIEIKTLFSAERIVNIVGTGDTSDFIDQCMFGLWLTGRKWIDLAIWCPALANIGLEMTIVHIERDEAFIEELEADLMAFASSVKAAESALRTKAAARATAKALEHAASTVQAQELQVCLCDAPSESSELVIPMAEPVAHQAVIDMAKELDAAVAVMLTSPASLEAQAAQFDELEQSEIKRLANLNSSLIVEVVNPVALDSQKQPDDEETIRLGQISSRLGFTVTADFLASLGFAPVATDKSAKLYRESDFQRICQALVRHINSVCAGIEA